MSNARQREDRRRVARMNQPTLALPQALSRATAAYKAGQFAAAEHLCRQVVDSRPDLFDALHLLAIVQSRLGKKDAALANFDRALALRPDSAEAHFNRGLTLHALSRFADALSSYDRALALRPDYAGALLNRGVALYQLERYEEALANSDRALMRLPDHADTLLNRGLALHALKRFAAALSSYDRALAVRPGHAEALSNRGLTLHAQQRFDEALSSYDRALAARPDYAQALCNRGLALHELKRYDEALASYDRALTLRPDYAEALSNRGLTLHAQKHFDEALASYDRALALRPDYAEAHFNRGLTLDELARFDEALASYDRALALRPDYAEAHLNEGLLRLLLGDFDRGWAKYEWRWKNASLELKERNSPRPLWLGADAIAGKTVLLHSEQGFGDAIQFCRYVPLVAARGARVILEVERPLRELMTSLAGAAQVLAGGDALPHFDLQCPLLSLPLAFGTRHDSIPSAVPYLRAAADAVAAWSARLGTKTRPRIGLVWSGNPKHKNDENRSISLRTLMPLFTVEATFVSLQKDVRAADAEALKAGGLLDFGDALRDFSDTAALVANLDLVISVDTSVAHLAGALATPVWVLLPFVPDWRWLLDRDDSPWYPTARLFRQDATRGWDGVIARVRAALGDFVRS